MNTQIFLKTECVQLRVRLFAPLEWFFNLVIRKWTHSIYTNDYQSIVLFRCRSNTIKLNWRRIFEGGDTTCLLCNEEEETLEHFLLKCKTLHTVREQLNIKHLNIEQLLLFAQEGNMWEVKDALKRMYCHREFLMKN